MATANRDPEFSTVESDSLDFAVLIRLLWERRKVLGWTLLGAMLVAGVASYLVDQEFMASAKIIVEIPQRREETLIFPKPLSVLDYESILNTDRALEQVLNTVRTLRVVVQEMTAAGETPESIEAMTHEEIQNRTGLEESEAELLSFLQRRDIKGLTLYQDRDFRNLEFETFKKKFETRTVVVKETGVDIQYSPIIRLDARANQPEKSSLLTNLWALNFVENEKERASIRSERTVREILEIDRTIRGNLESAINRLKKYQEEVGIDQLKQEMQSKNFNLFGLVIQTKVETDKEEKTKTQSEQVTTGEFEAALIPQLAVVQKELMTTESQLLLLNAFLEQLEEGGAWVGQMQLNGNARQVASRIEAASAGLGRLNQRIEEAEQEYPMVALRDDLERLQNDLDQKREHLRTLEAQNQSGDPVEAIRNEVRKLSLEVQQLQATQKERQLLQQSVLGLRTCLGTLEARKNFLEAQSQLADGGDSIGLTWLQNELAMKDNELSKVRDQLFELNSRLSGNLAAEDVASLQAQRQFLEQSVHSLEEERDGLREEIQRKRQEQRLMARRIEEASGALGVFRSEYRQMKHKQSELTQKLQENQARALSLQTQIRRTRNEIEQLSQKLSAAESTLKGMESERDAFEKALETFADQYSEAIMEQFRQESDVRIHSMAVPPDRRVAPSRFLWVFTAGALAFVVNLLVILFQRLLETAPSPAPGRGAGGRP